MTGTDEIVETRIWRSGAEIVARVNWSHVARVRRALGVAGDEYGPARFERPARAVAPTPGPATVWATADACAA
jgi:hypothetical protein